MRQLPDAGVVLAEAATWRASSYSPLDAILQGDASTASLDATAHRLDIAARVGAPGALVCTGPLGARPIADADAVAACQEWLADAAPLAVERGLRIMVEPIHPLMRRWSYVHTLRHALDLTDGITGVGVLLDVGHVWWEQGLETIIGEHVDEIVSVQVTNVDRAALDELRYERTALDAGDVPVAALVATIEAAGYGGWYEQEIRARIPRDERLAALRASSEWFAALEPGGEGHLGG